MFILLQGRFNVQEEWQKDSVFKQMGCIWRSSKSKLLGLVRDAKSSTERIKLKPSNIPSIPVWNSWIKSRTSTAFKVTLVTIFFVIHVICLGEK